MEMGAGGGGGGVIVGETERQWRSYEISQIKICELLEGFFFHVVLRQQKPYQWLIRDGEKAYSGLGKAGGVGWGQVPMSSSSLHSDP